MRCGIRDGPQLVRQWTLLKLLGGARIGVTLTEMADESRVNPKTIRRDLQAFAEVGLAICP
jgi:predicted DNA-binding transcriptional regulator YafY